ncbi:MAG: efflux RND transporter periplasmic adaptor subunit [bacterium]
MRMRTLAVVGALLLVLQGCGRNRDNARTAASAEHPPESGSAAARAEASDIAEGAMCAEHGVLDAVCTKCNPALAAVFRAKGDWCAAHELPESICPICHPERGGRPAVDVTLDDSPADGMKVTLKTKETARLAGITTSEAQEGFAISEAVATARVVYDATRVAEVSARAPGVVRAIKADVGARVRAGSPLAIIESAGVGEEQSKLKAAASRVKVAEANYERMRGLHDSGIAAEREVQAALQDLDAARAELETAQAALGVVDADAGGAARYALASPLAGVVTKRAVSVGKVVNSEDVLFEVVDTSRLWAEVDIAESDASRVTAGQQVVLTFEGIEGEEIHGTLEYVAPEIDAHTRTVKGRVVLDNASGRLRANMFGRARITLIAPRHSVVVPRGAVQRARDVQLVFVQLAEDLYEARRVQVFPSDALHVAVVGGIAAGARVVTDGSFFLKTETLKESIGAGCCAVD